MNFSASSGRQPRTQTLLSELLGPPIVTAAISIHLPTAPPRSSPRS